MAKDVFHDIVKRALINDKWHITHDPLTLQVMQTDIHIDLGAEKIIAAEKKDKKIAVEIKSFVGNSTISEFHTALGQYLNYRMVLEDADPNRHLYLAIPVDTYTDFFTARFTQKVLGRYQISLLVYDTSQEEVVKWLD